jgi:hypothetical protein
MGCPVTYFPDLSPYTYHQVEGAWGELLNIGWLERGHAVPTGSVPEDFVRRLAWLCAHTAVQRTRGIHRCTIPPCASGRDAPRVVVTIDGEDVYLGGAEVWVGVDGGIWYAAPDLVYHYVTAHGYRPPDGFIEAVLRHPDGDAVPP